MLLSCKVVRFLPSAHYVDARIIPKRKIVTKGICIARYDSIIPTLYRMTRKQETKISSRKLHETRLVPEVEVRRSSISAHTLPPECPFFRASFSIFRSNRKPGTFSAPPPPASSSPSAIPSPLLQQPLYPVDTLLCLHVSTPLTYTYARYSAAFLW